MHLRKFLTAWSLTLWGVCCMLEHQQPKKPWIKRRKSTPCFAYLGLHDQETLKNTISCKFLLLLTTWPGRWGLLRLAGVKGIIGKIRG
jgi:hypothetical protein